VSGSLAAQVRPGASPPAESVGPVARPGSVEGKVTNSVTQQPIVRATVYLDDFQHHLAYTATTDASGEFRFDNVTPGDTYAVGAERPGFRVDPQRASRAFSGVRVADGQDVTGVDVRLTPLGVIAGRVLDAGGDPIPGVDVRLFVRGYSNGESQLLSQKLARSDDRGVYRFFDLDPGTYFIRASPRPEPFDASVRVHNDRPEELYAEAFYPASPGTPGSIEVTPGAEVTGIDFHLQQYPAYHIRGKITDATTGQAVAALVTILPCQDVALNLMGGSSSRMQQEGIFDSGSLVPGSYCLTARGANPSAFRSAQQTVEVKDRDVEGVTLAMMPGAEVHSRVQFDGAPPESPGGQIQVSLAPLVAQTGSVQGRVTETLRGKPVAGALVSVQSMASTPAAVRDFYTTVTDAHGRYQVVGLPPGKYSASATRQGFIASPAFVRPDLAAGQTVTLDLELTPCSVIAGRILDSLGEPVRNVSVQAMQYVYNSGKHVLANASQAVGLSDDRGEYRLSNLRPGRYYLFATLRDVSFSFLLAGERTVNVPRRTAFMATYYPDARDAGRAVPLQVAPAEEFSRADIHLQESAVYTIRMPVPVTDNYFMLHARGANPVAASAGEAFLAPTINGVWTAQNVPPGSYIVTGWARMAGGGPGAINYFRQVVDVSDHDVDIPAPHPIDSFDSSGSVRVEGKAPARIAERALVLQPDEPGTVLSATVSAAGTFTLRNVLPQSYQFRYDSPPGFYLKRIKLGDGEVSDTTLDFSLGPAPLILVLAKDGGRVEGSVGNVAAGEAAHPQIVLVPEGAQRNLKDAVADEMGHYSFEDVAPGTYRLYAFIGAENGAPLDPEYRKPYHEQSVAVKVEPGGVVTVALQPIRAGS